MKTCWKQPLCSNFPRDSKRMERIEGERERERDKIAGYVPLSSLCWCRLPVALVCILDFKQSGEVLNTLRTGDADLRFYITTVQDG